tara:strand:+ start:167930 stop:171133 length:3204 start_codon:yes stop_codon:yes gene_type:complete
MNIIMAATLVVGAWSFMNLRREFFPNYELESIFVTVQYPGASPEEVEAAILEKVEEAVRTIEGVDEMTSSAREGSGSVVLELDSNIDEQGAQRILAEVRSQIDQIPSLPELAEEPDIRQSSSFRSAVRLGVVGPNTDGVDARLKLRDVAERVRADLMMLPSVTQADLTGVPAYQIDIEISEKTLRQYNLTLPQVANIVRRENLEIPGGTLRTESQEILLRGANRREIGEEIAEIPLVTRPDGVVLRIGDLGMVRDEFTDEIFVSELDKRPALMISVDATETDDLVSVADEVFDFIDNRQMPDGYDLVVLSDSSEPVRSRLSMLAKNGWMGLCLVFLMLAIFLEMRLAFWVALGIPISLLGASAFMLYSGHTLNMTTMFAFLIALGIVVDDAIVIGENIFVHREQGKGLMSAAIDGAYEVMPAVVTSVATTVIAFLPVMYLEGRLQRLAAALPACVGAMLILSLVESLTILPAHLGHRPGWLLKSLSFLLIPFRPIGWLFAQINRAVTTFLDWFIESIYLVVLRWALRNQIIVLSLCVGLLLVSVGIVRSGIVPFLIFPRVDQSSLTAEVKYPDGTPASLADEATRRIEDAILKVGREAAEEGLTTHPDSIVMYTHRTVGRGPVAGFGGGGDASSGSHVGGVSVRLVPVEDREIWGQEITQRWRQAAGRFPGAESVSFGGRGGPAGNAIELRLMAGSEYLDEVNQAVARVQQKLREYDSVDDIATDSHPGKWEYQLRIRDDAQAMGVTLADLAGTVRASYYGDEVMRLQRGRHEVQLRVRYPREERESLAGFDDIRVRLDDGDERPLTELVDIAIERGPAEISRIDQMRSIIVTADVDEESGNAYNIVQDLDQHFLPELQAEFPNVRFRWQGQQEQTTESVNNLTLGFCGALAGMFLLLTIQFRSYSQALLILSIIPFGFIGAILGHVVMGLQLTLFSIFGIVALSGVVVNDSIVLVDFANRRRQAGMAMHDALIDAGRRRFRPVILTSVTTIAGMLPILLEQSRQAMVVVPMAASLSFGLMLATAIVLVLGPTLYSLIATGEIIDEEDEEYFAENAPSQTSDVPLAV